MCWLRALKEALGFLLLFIVLLVYVCFYEAYIVRAYHFLRGCLKRKKI